MIYVLFLGIHKLHEGMLIHLLNHLQILKMKVRVFFNKNDVDLGADDAIPPHPKTSHFQPSSSKQNEAPAL